MIDIGNANVAEYYAILLMTMTIMLNVYSVASISYLIGHRIDLVIDTKFKIVLFPAFLTILFYFSFVHDNRYLKIAKIYEMESDKSKTKGKLAAISYIVFSIILLILSFYLMILKNKGKL